MRPVPPRKPRAVGVPHPRTRRALIIVDVERRFITRMTRRVIPIAAELVREAGYAHVIVAEHTKGRLVARDLSRRERAPRTDETVEEIAMHLDPARTSVVPKSTRSVFGPGSDVARELRRHRIREVHLAGIETHDCVLATAIDAFDHGFVTCVIERACASRRETDHQNGLRVLRRLHLTDTSLKV